MLGVSMFKRPFMVDAHPKLTITVDKKEYKMVTKIGVFNQELKFDFTKTVQSEHPATSEKMETSAEFKNNAIYLNRIYPNADLTELVRIYFEEDILVMVNTLSEKSGKSAVAIFYHKTQ